MSMMKDEKALLQKSIEAALKAGEAILDVYKNEDFGVEMKSDNSPLTIADKRAHEIIVKTLKSTGYNVLSEEGKNIDYKERSQWEKFWMVDPLDGTKEFVKRNGEFTVNIALIENNTPVMGVIFVPVLSELYFASDFTGAKKININTSDLALANDIEKLSGNASALKGKKTGEDIMVVASRSHFNEDTENFINKLKTKFNSIDFVSKGSSLKLCLVAEGVADIYPRFAPTMEWDTAAGHAIIKHSGNVMTQKDEKTPVVYNKQDLLNPWFIVRSGEMELPEGGND